MTGTKQTHVGAIVASAATKHVVRNTVHNNFFELKGTAKSYFMYYSRAVIILFNTGLQKYAFPTYSFGKARFSSFYVLVFHVSVSVSS